MIRHRLRTGFLFVAISAFAAVLTLTSSGQEKKEAAPKDKSQLDRDSYRVKVEPILEGNEDMAVYRVQVWTLANPEHSVIGYGGMIGRGGLFQPEKNGNLHRGEFIVVVSLRDAKEIQRQDGKAELELNFATVGGRVIDRIIDHVDATTLLNKVLQVKPTDGIYKLPSKQSFGRYQGKALTIWVQ